mmetsp:Transcript_42174/g.134889  ORF Transcript_42174/g.134889 Transcript_42174/m.134889 type:complete len:301 (+) Transcript_42174:137-1039(+)
MPTSFPPASTSMPITNSRFASSTSRCSQSRSRFTSSVASNSSPISSNSWSPPCNTASPRLSLRGAPECVTPSLPASDALLPSSALGTMASSAAPYRLRNFTWRGVVPTSLPSSRTVACTSCPEGINVAAPESRDCRLRPAPCKAGGVSSGSASGVTSSRSGSRETMWRRPPNITKVAGLVWSPFLRALLKDEGNFDFRIFAGLHVVLISAPPHVDPGPRPAPRASKSPSSSLAGEMSKADTAGLDGLSKSKLTCSGLRFPPWSPGAAGPVDRVLAGGSTDEREWSRMSWWEKSAVRSTDL